MEKCTVCGKLKIKELFWEKGKNVLRNICVNPKCKTYTPYVNYIWK